MIHDFGCAHDAEFRQVRSMLKKGAYDSHSDTDSLCFKSENVMSGTRPPGKASCCNFQHGWQVRILPQAVTQARTVEGLRLGAVCLPIKRSGRQNAHFVSRGRNEANGWADRQQSGQRKQKYIQKTDRSINLCRHNQKLELEI